MSLYGTLTTPSALYPGDSFNCINSEASSVYPAGTAGERVALAQNQDGSPRTISMELAFSVNPGAFTIGLQTADTDIAGAYQNEPNGVITAAAQQGGAGLYYARVELQVKAKFARPIVTVQPVNACTIRSTITG
jgi:hypothetical protein